MTCSCHHWTAFFVGLFFGTTVAVFIVALCVAAARDDRRVKALAIDPGSIQALAGLAILHEARGEYEQALELLLIVLNHPACIQESKDRAARLCTELEGQLAPLQIKSVKVHAGEITLESVVKELLSDVTQ